MDLSSGIGLLLAALALVAPFTPGFQSGWVVSGIWLSMALYACFLVSSNWETIAKVLSFHTTFSTVAVGAYAFLAAAGLWHSYVTPLLKPYNAQDSHSVQETLKQPSNAQSPLIGRLLIFGGSNLDFWWIDANGKLRQRVQVLAYFKIVNTNPTPITVEAIGIEIQEGDQFWHKLEHLPNGKLFWVKPNDLAQAREVHAVTLNENLLSRRLQQNEGAEGWVLSRYAKADGPQILKNPSFRLSLRDNTGKPYLIDNVRAGDYAKQTSGLTMSGDTANITMGGYGDISRIPEIAAAK